MTAVVYYFQVHQPYRIRRYSYFDIGTEKDYFDDGLDEAVMKRVAERCYVPMNELLLEAIERTDGRFRCSFSISGTALEQMEEWAPEALDSFVALAETECVEFLCETSHHSMSAMANLEEFDAQIELQKTRITELFGRTPTAFRNTELVFDDSIAKRIEDHGFEVLLGEGADQLLGDLSSRQVYRPTGCKRLKLLLRDYLFSDDIAFRFSNKEWPQYPLMADTFAEWLHKSAEDDTFIGLFMDYETFGEHQAADTGILDFMRYTPEFILADERFSFRTPSQLAEENEVVAELHAPRPISWADAERDLSAWLGNHMQRAGHEAVYALGPDVERAAKLGHPELLSIWRKLTTSDHTYYMSTKWHTDGDVHEYFSPYDSPHDAFITYMNVLDDLTERVESILAPLSPPHKDVHH